MTSTKSSKKEEGLRKKAEAEARRQAEAAEVSRKQAEAEQVAAAALASAEPLAKQLGVGTSTLQGNRDYQEDRVVASKLEAGPCEGGRFVAVYDGHCGVGASEFAAQQLHVNIAAAGSDQDMDETIRHTFLNTNEAFLSEADDGSGTTAVVVIVVPDSSGPTIHVGHVVSS
eukprot:gene8594-10206_t